MDIVLMLEQAYSEMTEVAAKVRADDLDRPTPCTDWDVRALANHFLWASTVLAEATAGKPGPDPSVLAPGLGADSNLVAGADVAGSVALQLEVALRYWRRPGALEAICQLPIGQIPGFFAAYFNLVDISTHRWDLARAIGQNVTIDDQLAEAALTFARGALTDELRTQVGIAPAVPVDTAASPGDQLVAFLGRHP